MEFTLAERVAIRAALKVVAWEIEASEKQETIPVISMEDWRFRTNTGEDTTLGPDELRFLAYRF